MQAGWRRLAATTGRAVETHDRYRLDSRLRQDAGGRCGRSPTTRSSSAAATTASSAPPTSPGPGLKTLVLEQRHVLGGAAVTEELFPGFRFSVFSYVVSLLRPEIIRELDLPQHGLDILPLDGTFTPLRKGDGPKAGGGDYLWRVNDHGRTIRELRRWSASDAEAYEEYGQLMVEMARFIKPILAITPPDLTEPRPAPADAAGRPGPALPAAARAPAGGLRPAHDDERRRTSSTSGSRPTRSRRRWPRRGSSARTRASRARARRTCCSTTTWARSTARSAPGASPRAAPAAISNAIGSAARALGAEIRLEAPVAQVIVTRRPGDRRRARIGRGDPRRLGPVVARRAADVPRPPRARHARPDVRGRGPPVQVPRLVGQGQPGRRPPARLHLPARRRRAPPRRDQLQPVDRRHGDAPTTTRSTAASAASRTST